MLIFWCTSSLFAANIERTDWQWVSGRTPERLVIKFHEESGIVFDSRPDVLRTEQLVVDPLFSIPQQDLMEHYQHLRKSHEIEDLRTYIVVQGSPVELDSLAQELLLDSDIEHIYRDFAPAPPPNDIDPPTPLFYELQQDHLSVPLGFGFADAQRWTMGSGIRVANIEYAYDPTHEDLISAPVTQAWGWESQQWQFHGNGVLGQLVAPANGYGVTGAIPDAEVLMISPYSDVDVYNVGEAIIQSLNWLVQGDVILIEQQTVGWEAYCPMEYIPAVFDAIQWAVAEGVSVVEPAANGSQDLDATQWEGWFDLEIQDSGAIMVGGGGGLDNPQVWSGGSSFGSRIDVQGWYQNIVTVGGYEIADLFFPQDDVRQAYTQHFGGTSGASPQVVSVVVALNSLSLQLDQSIDDPKLTRELLRQNGISQPAWDQDFWIAAQPNLYTLLRMWAW